MGEARPRVTWWKFARLSDQRMYRGEMKRRGQREARAWDSGGW